MTPTEYKAEHRLTYDTRLAILGCYGTPTAEQHNMAVAEADAHIAALRKANRDDAIQPLRDLKNSL